MSIVLLLIDFAVVFALTLFLLLVIRGLGQAVKARLKRGFADSVSAYDELIEAKSRELRALEDVPAPCGEELPPVTPAVRSTQVPDQLPSATFANGAFAQTYRLVRSAYAFDTADAVRDAVRRAPEATGDRAERCAAARSIRALFDHETLFDLVSLPTDRQLAVLREVLDGDGASLLEAYVAERGWSDALAFSHWLDAVCLTESDEVTVTVGEGSSFDASRFPCSRPVRACTSADVFEGALVRIGGTLYDYSLRSKDLI